MAIGLLNLFMLVGMVGLVIPVIIHLLNRRRFEVVDWGAMRFLIMSETTRRRVFIEELLLMLLRMGLIALLVLAMCAPFVSGTVFRKFGIIENRDIVIVFDGSTAMSFVDDDGKTAHEHAIEWTKKFLDRLEPGDTVAIVQAREQAVTFVEPTSDLSQVRKELDKVSAPAGSADWPTAVETAHKLLVKTSHRPRRDIVLLSAGRKTGWSDQATMDRWKLLAPQLAAGKETPRLWVVPFAKDAPDPAPNWSLTQVTAGKVGTDLFVQFGCSLRIEGQNGDGAQQFAAPHRLRYEIDLPPGTERPKVDIDRLGRDIEPPKTDAYKNGRLPLTFPVLTVAGPGKDDDKIRERNEKSLPGPGSHLISVEVVADDPETGENSKARRDRFPGDNRRYFAIMVPLVPVLLVDGLPPLPDDYQGADFLQAALQPGRSLAVSSGSDKSKDPRVEMLKKRLVRAKVEPLSELEAALQRDIGPEPNTKPRVLVLCDVPSLTEKQQSAIEEFVRKGGGVLVTVGPRASQSFYNKELYRDGSGWLPAALQKATGDENEPLPSKDNQPDRAAHPVPATFNHTALNDFAKTALGGIDRARFPRWWVLTQPSAGTGTVVAELLARDPKPERSPWLVEKKLGEGRVLQCCVPLDSSWGTNFHTREVTEYALLANNLISYLSGPRLTDYSLAPGQPIVYPLLDDERGTTTKAALKTPRGDEVKLDEKDGVVTHKDTRLSGVYVLTTPRNRTVYFVVQPDVRSGEDLAPWTDDDRKQVIALFDQRGREAANRSKAEAVKVEYGDDAATILRGPDRDVWWLFLVGVTALLCCEVWMTRRIAQGK
jgi:hypothetical protein